MRLFYSASKNKNDLGCPLIRYSVIAMNVHLLYNNYHVLFQKNQ